MTTKEFIEKAIRGGYDEYPPNPFENYFEIILDPKAWEAVGKVEGWGRTWFNTGSYDDYDGSFVQDEGDKWVYNMHQMIDALVEGKTIEEYLSTL